jgi:hypothetical protein
MGALYSGDDRRRKGDGGRTSVAREKLGRHHRQVFPGDDRFIFVSVRLGRGDLGRIANLAGGRDQLDGFPLIHALGADADIGAAEGLLEEPSAAADGIDGVLRLLVEVGGGIVADGDDHHGPRR